MNPGALVILFIALVLIVVAWKGTQDNVIAAVIGRQYGNSTIR